MKYAIFTYCIFYRGDMFKIFCKKTATQLKLQDHTIIKYEFDDTHDSGVMIIEHRANGGFIVEKLEYNKNGGNYRVAKRLVGTASVKFDKSGQEIDESRKYNPWPENDKCQKFDTSYADIVEENENLLPEEKIVLQYLKANMTGCINKIANDQNCKFKNICSIFGK